MTGDKELLKQAREQIEAYRQGYLAKPAKDENERALLHATAAGLAKAEGIIDRLAEHAEQN